MSETQKKLELTIASAKHTSDTPSGWKKYTIAAADGNDYNVVIPPKSNYVPTKDDKVSFYEGRYGGWVLDEENNDDSNSPSKGKSEYQLREEYWNARTEREAKYQDYTKGEVNPKMEFQTYLNTVKDFYTTALPYLKNPPTDTQSIDAYIDDAYAKAEAIYIRRQKSFEKKDK